MNGSQQTIPPSAGEEIAEIINGARRHSFHAATGISAFDAVLGGGFCAGDLSVLCARPGAGKTTLAGQVAANIAENDGCDVVYATTEMSKARLVAADLARRSDGRLTQRDAFDWLADPESHPGLEPELERYKEGAGARIHYLAGGVSVGQVESAVCAIQRSGRRCVVVVDYLSGLRPAGKADLRRDRNEIVHSVDRLRRLAVDRCIPVVCLSAITRQHYSKPRSLDCLAESATLEQSAAVVVAIQRDEKSPKSQRAVLHVLKNRFGEVADVPVVFDFEHARVLDAGEKGKSA